MAPDFPLVDRLKLKEDIWDPGAVSPTGEQGLLVVSSAFNFHPTKTHCWRTARGLVLSVSTQQLSKPYEEGA